MARATKRPKPKVRKPPFVQSREDSLMEDYDKWLDSQGFMGSPSLPDTAKTQKQRELDFVRRNPTKTA